VTEGVKASDPASRGSFRRLEAARICYENAAFDAATCQKHV